MIFPVGQGTSHEQSQIRTEAYPLVHRMEQYKEYRIAGKFGGQKIWQIVLKVEKIKIWRNLNLANSYRLA